MVNQDFSELDSLLAGYDQQQLLCCWDQLDQVQQTELAQQVREIDLEQLAGLLANRDNVSRDLPQQIAPPPAIRPSPTTRRR